MRLFLPFLLSITLYLVATAFIATICATKGYAQTLVYATHHGSASSAGGLAAASVSNATRALGAPEPPPDFARMAITVVLVGSGQANLQLKFINGSLNLPAGTAVYIRVAADFPLLNILTNNAITISARQGATATPVDNPLSNGTTVSAPAVDVVQISGQPHIRVIPSQCFNAITISFSTGGLALGTYNLDVYHAYYECPTITVPQPTICFGQTATLQVSNPNTSCGNYGWYSAATGGTPLHTGTSFTPPPLTTTTTYYVEHSNVAGSCGRTPVTVTVNNVTGGSIATNQSICTGATAGTLTQATSATGSGTLTYQWESRTVTGSFANIVGATGTTYSPGTLTQTMVYRRTTTSTLNGIPCTASSNEITVTVNPLPAAPTINSQTICAGLTALLSINSPAGGVSYRWYTVSSGGTPFHTGSSYTTPALSNNTTYYVDAFSSTGCVSATRTAVTVTVNPLPAITTSAIPSICEGETSSLLVYTGTANSPNEYRITWVGSPIGFLDTDWTTLPSSPIILAIPSTATTGDYTGIINVRNNSGCESINVFFSIKILPKPRTPHMTIADIQH